jgi:dephospho-CoA kinase
MAMAPKIIGLVGRPGTGKDTFVSALASVTGQSVEKFSFSRILIDEYCKHLSIEPTHPNLQYIGDAIRPEWLHDRAREVINGSTAAYVVIPSIRRQADFDFIKSFPGANIIGIETDEKIAFERMKLRKEKPGEEFLTWEAYQALLGHAIDAEIPVLLQQADIRIQNNGSVDDFATAIQKSIQ